MCPALRLRNLTDVVLPVDTDSARRSGQVRGEACPRVQGVVGLLLSPLQLTTVVVLCKAKDREARQLDVGASESFESYRLTHNVMISDGARGLPAGGY